MCYLKVKYILNVQTDISLYWPNTQSLILGTGSQYAIKWTALDPDYVERVIDSLSTNGGISFIIKTGAKNNDSLKNPWQSFHYWRVSSDIVLQEWGSLDNCKIKIVAIGTSNAYDVSDNPFKIVNFPWYYSGTSDSRWEEIHGGTANDILVHPEDNGVILLAGGGISRSEDFGNSWTFLEETSGATFECIEYAPSSPDIIYAGVGFTLESDKRGVWKSTDGGRTFFRTSGSSQMDIHYVKSISIHPTNPNIVYVAGYKEEVVGEEIVYIGRVYKTTDGGNTWVLKTSGLPYYGYFRSIAVSPSNPNVIYLGMGYGGLGAFKNTGIWKSTNGGNSWVQVSNGLVDDSMSIYADIFGIAIDPSNSDEVYASVSFDGWGDPEPKVWGIYKTTNGGNSWFPVNQGVDSSTYALDIDIFMNGEIILSGSNGDPRLPNGQTINTMWMSLNKGKTWIRTSEDLGRGDVRDVEMDLKVEFPEPYRRILYMIKKADPLDEGPPIPTDKVLRYNPFDVPPSQGPSLQITNFTSSSITVSWTPIDNVAGYKLAYKEEPNGSWQTINVYNRTSYTLTNLTGEAYSVKVKGYNFEGDGPFSNTVFKVIKLNPPSDLHATVNSDYTVTLSWSDNSWFNDGYEVWRESEVEGKRLVASIGDVTSYTDNTAKFGHEYRYFVYAVKGGIRSVGDSFEVLTRPNTIVYKDDATFSFYSRGVDVGKKIYALYGDYPDGYTYDKVNIYLCEGIDISSLSFGGLVDAPPPTGTEVYYSLAQDTSGGVLIAVQRVIPHYPEFRLRYRKEGQVLGYSEYVSFSGSVYPLFSEYLSGDDTLNFIVAGILSNLSDLSIYKVSVFQEGMNVNQLSYSDVVPGGVGYYVLRLASDGFYVPILLSYEEFGEGVIYYGYLKLNRIYFENTFFSGFEVLERFNSSTGVIPCDIDYEAGKVFIVYVKKDTVKLIKMDGVNAQPRVIYKKLFDHTPQSVRIRVEGNTGVLMVDDYYMRFHAMTEDYFSEFVKFPHLFSFKYSDMDIRKEVEGNVVSTYLYSLWTTRVNNEERVVVWRKRVLMETVGGEVVEEIAYGIDEPPPNNANRILEDNSGNIHFVYSKNDSVYDYVLNSSERYFIGRGKNPALSVDDSNNLYCVFAYNDTTGLEELRFSRFTGDGWTEYIPLWTSTGTYYWGIGAPSFDIYGDKGYVAWEGMWGPTYHGPPGYLPTDIKLWSGKILMLLKFNLDTPDSTDLFFTYFISSIGKLPPPQDTFPVPVPKFYDTLISKLISPSIVLDNQGKIHLIWDGVNDSLRYYYLSPDTNANLITRGKETGYSVFEPYITKTNSQVSFVFRKDDSLNTSINFGYTFEGLSILSEFFPIYSGDILTGFDPFIERNYITFVKRGGDVSELIYKEINSTDENILFTDYDIRSPQVFYKNRVLHFVFYAGDGESYSIYYTKVSFEKDLPVISLNFGNEIQSPGTLYREGNISYGSEYYKNVDYGDSLVYEIPFNPNSLYKIKFEGYSDEDLKEKIYINGIPLGNWHIEENEYSYFEKMIPNSAVSDILKIRIKRKKGDKAILGALKIYLERETGNDGPQSAGTKRFMIFDIKFPTLLDKSKVFLMVPGKGRVKLGIFDITGRKRFYLEKIFKKGIHTVNIPEFKSGIYFIKAEFQDKKKIKKILKIK